jgi:hypothetical protein
LISVGLAKVVYYTKGLLSFSFDNGVESPCNSIQQLRYTCLLSLLCLPWLLSSYKRKELARDEARQSIKPTSTIEALALAEADTSKSAEMARKSVAIRQSERTEKRRKAVGGIVENTIDDWRLTLEVHIISLLPPLWFFGFLYYTDVPSVIAVIGMLSAAKRGNNSIAATVSGDRLCSHRQ